MSQLFGTGHNTISCRSTHRYKKSNKPHYTIIHFDGRHPPTNTIDNFTQNMPSSSTIDVQQDTVNIASASVEVTTSEPKHEGPLLPSMLQRTPTMDAQGQRMSTTRFRGFYFLHHGTVGSTTASEEIWTNYYIIRSSRHHCRNQQIWYIVQPMKIYKSLKQSYQRFRQTFPYRPSTKRYLGTYFKILLLRIPISLHPEGSI